MIEQYLVKFNYKKPDGFWVIGADEEVDVEYDADNEKCNHDKAREIILIKYHPCSIVNVRYV